MKLLLPLLVALLGCPDTQEEPPCDESAWFPDEDGDGFGLQNAEVLACEAPEGSIATGGDCDDADPLVHPDAAELCDGLDTDCSGAADAEGEDVDADADGSAACEDCADDDPAISPFAVEACDGVDRDCSGVIDDLDLDGDGHSPCVLPGDCDDEDAAAFPRVLGPDGSDDDPGTPDAPLGTLAAAFETIDEQCRLVYVLEGEHEGGAVWVGGDVTIRGADPVASVLRSPDGGRTLEVSGGTVRVEDLTFVGGAESINAGPGITALNGALVQGVDVTFRGHRSKDYGGAVAAFGANLEFERATFEDNHASSGGAVYVESGRLESIDGRYEGNTGSAIDFWFARGALDGDRFVGNGGGAIRMDTPRELTVERCWFEGNTGRGGISAWGPTSPVPVFRNNVFVGNQSDQSGGGIAIYGFSAMVQILNNTLHGNTSAEGGAAIDVDAGASPSVYVASNLMTDNIGPVALNMPTNESGLAEHNTAFGVGTPIAFVGATGPDNVERDPVYVDAAAGDFSLHNASPARDSGPDTSELADLDGSRNDRGHTGGPGAD